MLKIYCQNNKTFQGDITSNIVGNDKGWLTGGDFKAASWSTRGSVN